MRNALFKLKVQWKRILISMFVLSSTLNPKKSMEFMMKATLLNQKVNVTIIIYICSVEKVIAPKFCYSKINFCERKIDPLQVETKRLTHRSNCKQVGGRLIPALNSSGTANKTLAAYSGCLCA